MKKKAHIDPVREEEIEALRAQAKASLPPRLEALADRYGFRYNRVTIKRNASNWGSCSSKGNINLNLSLMRVPRPLQDYILLHELTHLHHLDHGPDFHGELERLLADHFSLNAQEADFQEFVSMASASRAHYPYTHTLQKALKAYRPVGAPVHKRVHKKVKTSVLDGLFVWGIIRTFER